MESANDIFALIMAGGLGTRLWSLTAGKTPKAFLSFDESGESLLQRTISRISQMMPMENILIVAGKSHEKELTMQAHDVPKENLILEPVGRSTLPCIGFAGLYVKKRNISSVLIVLPGEQLIKDEAKFRRLLTYAVETARNSNSIVTLGIKPVFPATRFGYIQIGDEVSHRNGMSVFRSLGFTEKPDESRAQEFLSSERYFWNSGIYILPVLLLFDMISRFTPDIYDGLTEIDESIGTPDEEEVINRVYSDMRSISIDYAVMERSENMLVIPADIGWNDMGTWAEVAETWGCDKNRNSCLGRHVGVDSSDCIIYSTDRLIATVGVKGLIIVNTTAGILVCDKDRADDVKTLVQKLVKEAD